MPQRIIFGPLLWSVFDDDLKPDSWYIKYADDTPVYSITKMSDVTGIQPTSCYVVRAAFSLMAIQTAAARLWAVATYPSTSELKSVC